MDDDLIPPKPPARQGPPRLWRFLRDFRRDILSAQSDRLYHAWMAEYRNPLVHSFTCNDPRLVDLILCQRPLDFPKSRRMAAGLEPLLGQSSFVSNGDRWLHQRRIIDPAFEGGRLRQSLPAIWQAAQSGAARLALLADGADVDIQPHTSHVAADAICRAMFSIPIEDRTASQVFAAFGEHQDAQPMVNLGALLPVPRWLRLHRRRARRSARRIRDLVAQMVAARATQIAEGRAPDDLATKLMTLPDPQTGQRFARHEMIDEVVTFFLAGHETSASALAWALYLLAISPAWQDRLAAEARACLPAAGIPDLGTVRQLTVARAVFREALRLYPPVAMTVREARRSETLRGRTARPGAQMVLSPWHLHRHQRLWPRPDSFDPGRWLEPAVDACPRHAFIPFSAGPRACPGAGFAMIEGPLVLAALLRDLAVAPGAEPPVPVMRLTLRGRDGIGLRITRRSRAAGSGPDDQRR
ncbi:MULTISPECIES: cytochrome P450 [unclassified Paracoccus (in: a-proteobacteria)]|uniref:cytochrome P450 n=1 Tax=unclassified Paracoccus (in: a-proteobacteria) TaxID=2688777 RepID=UPI0021E17EF7|nr:MULTISPECIES: cytochrome P450 [unclassified Paracoccus (in: a-proteobacteria)]UXU74651.1 cytochrome P450 [Paracoccus sp. SMMA_5]UXU80546.1 cytochrome P450 [Paracoccus sp. SMMA_5_TC]